MDSPITSNSFQLAEMRSECVRVKAVLSVLVSLFALVCIRAGMSLAHGHRGYAWPFAVLLAATTVYELAWLKTVKRKISLNHQISRKTWTVGLLVESLLPTLAVFLQVYTPFIGPARALLSPALAAYFVFIILSTLHLDVMLSRLAGCFAAAGYALVSLLVFVGKPEVAAGGELFAYGASVSYVVLLGVAGFAAGEVANQIRLHVVTSLNEVETRTRLERDLKIARTIQQGLLPKAPPKIDGFDIAGWNQPADDTGGDYYDWQQLMDGRLAITVADVTGHGVGPAIGMAGCRAYARAGLAEQKDLRCFLSRLNQLLYDDLPPEKFVTLAAGALNPSDASLELISAGHGPLIFYSSHEDRFYTYDAQGPPLGLLPRFAYGEPEKMKFCRGDILALVTDGFLEWTNANDEEFHTSRVEQVIREHRELDAAAIISELYSAVLKFAGPSRQLDDLTALIVKRV